MAALLARYPSLSYVLPFATFMAFLGLRPYLPFSPLVRGVVWLVVVALVIVAVARPVLDLRLRHPLGTIGVGIGVFLIWIAPDQLIPGYRDLVIFQNGITGRVESTMAVENRNDGLLVALRFARASLLVPIVEELFWRGWLPRWLDRMEDFRAVPLGTFTRYSFLATAALFAVEHGPFWDVGLVAGVVYNWWMIRTRSLGDLIWCHAVTNACLGAWVLAAGQWQYW